MVKTITITGEAYRKLKKLKIGKESFSYVINRINSPKRDIKSIVGIMKDFNIEEVKKKIRLFRGEFTKDMGKRKDVLTRQLSNIRDT